ncbi:helix-turn-helix domain-containing protein [Auraticoccus monumenti]|uniref:Helix-turn-helix domain-containing protein n=1 Tax=Auraticoccus monumenti TaxID=675864 RepID=A0A1G6USQ3_9ACTN|nr:helix-turn-helix transcriptional regulator [Auraticoccus monumenti]SDD43597.1 Helix-turn-helix domain-containing protein [Auraticoccus monumenti]
MSSERERFAQIVKLRRQQLGLTHALIAARGGPSSQTLSNVEMATGSSPSPSTLRKLDEALEWQAGSAARALQGGRPTTRESESKQRSTRIHPSLSLVRERLREWAAGPMQEEPPSDALMLWDDRQLVEEMGRRLGSRADQIAVLRDREYSRASSVPEVGSRSQVDVTDASFTPDHYTLAADRQDEPTAYDRATADQDLAGEESQEDRS